MAEATLTDVYKAFGATEAALRAARANLVVADGKYRSAGSQLPQSLIDAWNTQRRDLINNVAYFTEKAIDEVRAIPLLGESKAAKMKQAIKEATGSDDPAIAMQDSMLPLKRSGDGALGGLRFAGANLGRLGVLPALGAGGTALAIGAAVAVAAVALAHLVQSFFPKARQAEAEAKRVEAAARLAEANATAYAKAVAAQVAAGVDPKTAAENAKGLIGTAPPALGGAFDWLLPVGIAVIAGVILWKSGVFSGGFKIPGFAGLAGRRSKSRRGRGRKGRSLRGYEGNYDAMDFTPAERNRLVAKEAALRQKALEEARKRGWESLARERREMNYRHGH